MAEGTRPSSIQLMVDWRLRSDVEHTRKAIIHRARSLAERLNRMADGLEADVNFGIKLARRSPPIPANNGAGGLEAEGF